MVTTGMMTMSLILTVAAGVIAGPGGKQPPPGWQDDFGANKVDKRRWVVASGRAPGYIPNLHIGYYQPDRVSVAGGILTMRLTQEMGLVGTNPNGVISRGALIYTKETYGYGTYEWGMRMSSTATSPFGDGVAESGSVSAGFIYVDNSQTEIDFEFSGNMPDTLYMVNWLNPNPASDPTVDNETWTSVGNLGITSNFHTYKFVWESGRISYYVDGVPKAEHTTNLPTAPAHFMINHWGTDSGNWGGTPSVGIPRYFYVDWVRYTPQ
jgi:beta-glucanase (GH16 family)